VREWSGAEKARGLWEGEDQVLGKQKWGGPEKQGSGSRVPPKRIEEKVGGGIIHLRAHALGGGRQEPKMNMGKKEKFIE